MSEQSHKCAIWPDFPATSYVATLGGDLVTSERAGGTYVIDLTLLTVIGSLDDHVKARLTTWLVDQRRTSKQRPVITDEVIRYAETQQRLSIPERAERLLGYLVEQPNSLGRGVSVSRAAALARTESIEMTELDELVTYLSNRQWLKGIVRDDPDNLFVNVSVEGHSHIEETKATAVASSQAFVAMWFHESMKAAYEEGMEPAIREAGYRPFRIDRKEHVNKIDDEIIAEIRQSKFLIADFTQDGEKARGGVYYEAGFAKGRGLEVIFTCRADSLSELHFDTRQYRHIVWTTPEELRDQLRNSILANFGEGPELDKSG